MEQLEQRFYSRQEIAQVVGITNLQDAHFARNIQNALSNWGYEYNYHKNGKGVTITRKPKAPEERLAELMQRLFGLDIQCDAEKFAYFLFLMIAESDYDAMPWGERAKRFEESYGETIGEATLKRWASKLLKSDHLHKVKNDKVIWQTTKDNGISIRKPVDENMLKEYEEYKARKSQYINEYLEMGLTNNTAWNYTFKRLWREFNCCYYTCPHFCINVISKDINAMLKLIKEICGIDVEG